MKNYFTLIICVIPLLAFSGCPQGCPPCIDQYFVKYSLDENLIGGTPFYIYEMCTKPDFTVSLYGPDNKAVAQILGIPSAVTTPPPLIGYCVTENDLQYAPYLRVDQSNRTFIAKVKVQQINWPSSLFYPFAKILLDRPNLEHCLRLKFLNKAPKLKVLLPCDGIELTIRLGIQKRLLTEEPIFVEDCPC